MSIIPPEERAAVESISHDESLTEVEKLWNITDVLFGGSSVIGPGFGEAPTGSGPQPLQ